MATEFGAAGYMQVAGSIFQMMASRDAGRLARIQGERARQAAEFAAWQAEEQAGIALAISQQQAGEQLRQSRLVASRALAVAAASGAGASDTTVTRILADIQAEGSYRSGVALYEGEQRARQLRLSAVAERIGGWDAQAAGAGKEQSSILSATGTAIRTASSLYARYGGDGPSGDAALIR